MKDVAGEMARTIKEFLPLSSIITIVLSQLRVTLDVNFKIAVCSLSHSP